MAAFCSEEIFLVLEVMVAPAPKAASMASSWAKRTSARAASGDAAAHRARRNDRRR
jgi:hypothetical protein